MCRLLKTTLSAHEIVLRSNQRCHDGLARLRARIDVTNARQPASRVAGRPRVSAKSSIVITTSGFNCFRVTTRRHQPNPPNKREYLPIRVIAQPAEKSACSMFGKDALLSVITL